MAASPSLPVKALASVGGAVATNAGGVAAHKSAVDLAYIWCRMYAENKPNFKPELLTEHLGFSRDVAKAAFKRMLKNDVVRPTGIRGIYQSTKPFVDMSHIYNPTTHFNKVVEAAKSKFPEIEAPTESFSRLPDEEIELLDKEQSPIVKSPESETSVFDAVEEIQEENNVENNDLNADQLV